MNYTVRKSGEEVKHRRLPLVGLGVERSTERAFARSARKSRNRHTPDLTWGTSCPRVFFVGNKPNTRQGERK